MSHPCDNAQDQELLQSWDQRQDETAFRQLVERHLGMVHATALRRTGSAESAREVSMTVFALLARRAASMQRHPCLTGWLHRAAYLEASNALRRELKHSRLMAALSDPSLTAEVDAAHAILNAVTPHLDEVLERLSSSDRDAVLLRYTERLSYEAMSSRLGKSADACQKQTSRALEKLSAMLLRRGITLSAAAAGTVITAGTAKAAPALLAGKIAAGALQKAAGLSTLTILHHAFQAMNTGKQIATGSLFTAALAALPLLIQQSEASALSRQADTPPVIRQAFPPSSTARSTPQKSAPDFSRTHPSVSAAQADATLRMIATLDGRQFSTSELFDLTSRLLDLPVEYMPRALESILAMKTTLLQPALGVALFARWGELDPKGAEAALDQPSFSKLHPYAREIAQTGIIMGMFETDPGTLLKSPRRLDMDFLTSGLPNMNPEMAKEFLARMEPRDRAQTELQMLFRRDPDHFETAAASLLASLKDALPKGNKDVTLAAHTAANLLAEQDPQRALAFAESLKDDPAASSSASYAALRSWSDRDAPAAIAWLNTQPVKTQKSLIHGLSPALEKMDAPALRQFAATGPEEMQPSRFFAGVTSLADRDPAAAARLAEEVPAPIRGRTWDAVANNWAEQDKMQASEWLVTLPAGADRNSAITGFTRHLVWEDAESAMIWAESISDPKLRADVVSRRIQVWLSTNHSQAQAWLEKSDAIPPEKKQALLKLQPHELKTER